MPGCFMIEIETSNQRKIFWKLADFLEYQDKAINEAPTYLQASLRRDIAESHQVEKEIEIRAGAPVGTLRNSYILFGTSEKTKAKLRRPDIILLVADPGTVVYVLASKITGLTSITLILGRKVARLSYPTYHFPLPNL